MLKEIININTIVKVSGKSISEIEIIKNTN